MSLPSDFLWGFATASYQIEGSVDADGRGPSIWDTFCATPGKIADASSGAVACDSYNRLADDVALLKSLGARAYRFSISWPRVIPLGGRHDPVNLLGLAYYQRLVDALLDAGIVPFATLYHWDLPDALERRYGGLLSMEEFPRDFERFARVCFEGLPRVRRWVTLNEPWCSAVHGYGAGVFAPGRCSDRNKSPVGDSGREPWIVGHNLLIAHGWAVKTYRGEFAPAARAANETDGLGAGEIGIALNGDATYPWDPEDAADVAAAERKLEFSIGWFADPIYLGDYPASMREMLGERLPRFTEEEVGLVRGSNDFYGMNHYTANYVRHRPLSTDKGGEDDNCNYDYDYDYFNGNVELLFTNKAGACIGPETQSPWLRPHPPGFRHLLAWLANRYNRPRTYVTENGTSVKGEGAMALEDAVRDTLRQEYFEGYVRAMAEAVGEDGADVRGYMAWSLLDNFEWAEGYQTRFGVTYVDFGNGQRRAVKGSARVLRPLFEELIGEEGEEGGKSRREGRVGGRGSEP